MTSNLYCIKVKSNGNCWIANFDGDPGRTLIKENAKIFRTSKLAEKLCSKLKSEYPNRDFNVVEF